MTAIHTVIESGEGISRIQDLLKSEPKLIFERKSGGSLLHTAILAGNLEVISYLADTHSQLVETSDKNGDTPLHMVGETLWLDEGRDGMLAAQIIPKLLNANASLERRNNRGQTPLLALSFRANTQPDWLKSIELLLVAGANPNAQDKKGCTYLHYIAQEAEIWSPLEIVDLLLKAGADLGLRNEDNQTPLDVCYDYSKACDSGGWAALVEALKPSLTPRSIGACPPTTL